MAASTRLTIGIPIYSGFDLLDLVGPHEVFSWLNSLQQAYAVEVLIIAKSKGAVSSRSKAQIKPDTTFAACPPLDVLFVPGGDPEGVQAACASSAYQSFIKRQAHTARYVTSVCVGALVLAHAGLLDGYCATTHWASLAQLASSYPAVKVVNGYPRYMIDRNRMTGGGISSGIDQALKLASMLTDDTVASAIQLIIQYSPEPPFQAGNPYTASYEVYSKVLQSFASAGS